MGEVMRKHLLARIAARRGPIKANAWTDGSWELVRGGKFDPQLAAGQSETAVVHCGRALKWDEDWQKVLTDAGDDQDCITLQVELRVADFPAAPMNTEGQPATTREELRATLHREAMNDAAVGDRAEIIRKLREMEGLGEASNAWVSNAQKAREAVREAEKHNREQLKEVQTGKIYMETANLKKFKQATEEEVEAKFRANAFAMYHNDIISTKVQEQVAQKTAAEQRVAREKEALEKLEKEKLDDEDDVDEEEYEFYAKRKRKRLICYLKSFFVLTAFCAGVAAMTIFYLRVYDCSFTVGSDHGVNETLRRNFSSLNTKLVQVMSNRGTVTVDVDDEEDVRVVVTHHARDFQTMRKIETRIEQNFGMVFVASDWDTELDGVFGGCPHSDIQIWLPRSMKVGTRFLKQVWNPDLNSFRGGYMDPVAVIAENIASIDVLVNATDSVSWMLPRRGDINVSLGENISFGNVTLQSTSGRVSLSGMLGSHAFLMAHGGDVSVSYSELDSVEVNALAANFSASLTWPWLLFHAWPVLERHVGTTTVKNVTFCEVPCSQWTAPRNMTVDESTLEARAYSWMTPELGWEVEAYHEYRGREAHGVLQSLESAYWYGRLSPDEMWVDFDLSEVYTLYGVALTGHVRGGIPDRCEFQSQYLDEDGVAHWQTVTAFQPDRSLDLQEFLGFEGTGRKWRLTIRGTYAAMEESLSVAFARDRDQDQGVAVQEGWHEIDQWKMISTAPAAHNGGFDESLGRFTVNARSTVACVATQVTVEAQGRLEVRIVVNGGLSTETGVSTFSVNSNREQTLHARGLLRMQAGDFISVWLHTVMPARASYSIDSQSGFSVALLDSDVGVGADLVHSQPVVATGWSELGGWSGSGSGGHGGLFDLGAGFDEASGRFTAGSDGLYMASSQVRLDGADTGYFRVRIALNGATDANDGLHVTDGSPSPDYAGFSVSGVLAMSSGDFISVWVHAAEDSAYSVNGQSGFSCAQLETSIGFGSRLPAWMMDGVRATGWNELGGWETLASNSPGLLFERGSGFDAAMGMFTAPVEGVYMMSFHLVLEFANTSNISVSLKKDSQTAATFNLRSGSAIQFTKMIHLERDSVFSAGISAGINSSFSYSVLNGSSYSCVLVSTSASGPALAQIDLLGYPGASTYDAGHGMINILSDDGNISVVDLADMSVEISTRRELQYPTCPIPPGDSVSNGIQEPAIGTVDMDVHVQEVQGGYSLTAPSGLATVKSDGYNTIYLASSTSETGFGPVPEIETGIFGVSSMNVVGEIGEASLTRQHISVHSESGNVKLAIRTSGFTVCPQDCLGQGRCMSDGKCSCYAGFQGPDCSEMKCPNSCSARGDCDFGTGTCTCDTQFMGRDCSKISCVRPQFLGGVVTEPCDICTVAGSTDMCMYAQSAPSITSSVSIILLLNRKESSSHSTPEEVEMNETEYNVTRARRYSNLTVEEVPSAPITSEGIISEIAHTLDLPVSLFRTVTFDNVSIPSTMWTPPICSVTLYGNRNFSGWQAEFQPGQYSLSILEANGVLDDDVESVFISKGCTAMIYEHSWGGWTTTLESGEYNATALAAAGVPLNELSAMIVAQTSFEPAPITRELTIELVAELPESRRFSEQLAQGHRDFDLLYDAAGHLQRTYHALMSHRRTPELISDGKDPTAEPSVVQYGGQSVYLIEVLIDCPNDCSDRALDSDCDRVTGTCTCQPVVQSQAANPLSYYYRDDCGLRTCPQDCTGRGLCDPVSGECSCFDDYIGPGCEMINCTTVGRGGICNAAAGFGSCNYETGRCSCVPGVSYGDNCDLYHCPMNCSKAGICDATTGDCRCNPGRVLADCSGRSCPAVQPEVTAVVSFAVDAADKEPCFVPWDDDDDIQIQYGYTCPEILAAGLCEITQFDAACRCSCMPSSNPRPCYLGNVLEYYDGPIAYTAAGTPCADWAGREELSPRHKNFCRCCAKTFRQLTHSHLPTCRQPQRLLYCRHSPFR